MINPDTLIASGLWVYFFFVQFTLFTKLEFVMHNTVNGIVAVCGSRAITEFADMESDVKFNLDLYMRSSYTINVGDASGVDYLVQSYLSECGYDKVKVWHCTEYPRNFVPHPNWELVKVEGNYTARDIAMCESSNELLAIWDNISRGTKKNINSFDKTNVVLVCSGVNISSQSRGIGGALIVNDKVARERKLINEAYPVEFKGKTYDCAVDIWNSTEVRYEYSKQELEIGKEQKNVLMTDILTAKFISNPQLWEKVDFRGGESWLRRCEHYLSRRSIWEGKGNDSEYINCLSDAFVKARRNLKKLHLV